MAASDGRLILASASPRRRELLARVGVAFDVLAADIDESALPGENPLATVRRVARGKADAIAARHLGRPVLAADTIVVLGGELLGKPTDAADAARMVGLLCGADHQVTTAFALARAGSSLHAEEVTTLVTMRAAEKGEVDAYVASGEWRGKAGGYAIQGIAAALVSRVEGSVTNVIGLPLAEVINCLRVAGIAVDLRRGEPA